MLVNGEDGDAGAHFGFGGGNSDDGGGSAKSIDSSVYEKLDEWKISYDQLENMSRPFGRGGFALVQKATLNGTEVAVKTLIATELLHTPTSGHHSKSVSSGSSTLSREDEAFMKEVYMLSQLRHPHVLLFMGFCLDPKAIITEFLSRGSLFDILHGGETLHSGMAPDSDIGTSPLSWKQSLKIAIGAAKGIAYLHSNNVLHRDLKSPNILVDENFRAVVADFGISRDIGTEMTQGVGTTRWIAPEVIEGGKYSKEVDVYAFGLVLYELISCKLPFQEISFNSQVEKKVLAGARPPLPDSCVFYEEQRPKLNMIPKSYRDLVKTCWEQRPSKRPHLRKILTELTKLFKAD